MEISMRTTALKQWLEKEQDGCHQSRGLSFNHLNISGTSSSDLVQYTFLSQPLAWFSSWTATLRPHTKRTEVPILHDFHGVLQQGEMLLVLGKPGAGCSTFLKTIGGDVHGTKLHDASTINYQGLGFTDMQGRFKGDSIYLSEVDKHLPELKVGETLSYASSMRQNNRLKHNPLLKLNNQGKSDSSSDIGNHISSIFGLSKVVDTPIGNEMLRGISGGEKKRVSIAEAFVSSAHIQCWDNSTQGLDSLTALEFVQTLRQCSKNLGTTTLMSIYQSLESIYECFDKVILLYEGREIYFGSTKSAAAYFENLGFLRPPRSRTADFLTSLTSPSEVVVRKGYEHKVPKSPDEFASIWRKSDDYKLVIDEIDRFNEKYKLSTALKQVSSKDRRPAEQKSASHSAYSISTYDQIKANLHRAYIRIKNNPVPMVSGIIGNGILAVILGSAFYGIPTTAESLQSRATLIFYTIMMNSCIPAFEVLTLWAQRPIVEKQFQYAFYAPPTEYLASMVIDLPNKIITSLFFNVPVYFMSNLRRDASAFFTFYLFSFLTMLTMSMVFRMVGSLSRTPQQAMTPVANIIMLFIIYTGFVVPKPFMVNWLGWITWVNPIAYAYESLMINELIGREYECSSMIPRGSIYGAELENKVCTAVGARPGEPYVLGNEHLRIKYSYAVNHLWRNFGILLAMMLVACSIHLVTTKYVFAARSKGEVLVYRYGYSPRKASNSDEESGFHVSAVHDNGEKARVEDEDLEGFPKLQRHVSVFHWSNLSYEIKMGKQRKNVLKNLNGWVKPGTLTALMGATGAGKTSLLDTLRGQNSNGTVTGDIFMDGTPRSKESQRHIAYVQQSDLHLPTATVREALQFSALLRQRDDILDTEKLKYVDTVLNMLELQNIADAVIGRPGEGLNVEQRKRLTIGVELVAKPELLIFLDEPTSGLDSQAAFSIVKLLRKIADAGQTVLCTIHQPSSQLFQFFDHLLLLQSGETIYFGSIGDQFSTMIDYFEGRGAVKCEDSENPAEWVMRVTGSRDTDQELSHWAHLWNSSVESDRVRSHIAELKLEGKGQERLTAPQHKIYASGLIRQLRFVVRRQMQEYWRDTTYVYAKITLCAGAALFNGLSFYNVSNSIQGLTSVMFSTFLLSVLFSTMDQQIIPRFITSRALFNAREKQSMTYSWVTFLASNIIVEALWQSFVAILVFACWYFPTGLWRSGTGRFDGVNGADWSTAERGGMIWILIWLFMMFTSGLSQAIAAGIDQAETGVNIAQLLFGLSTIFCGILVAPSALPKFWIFLYRVSPFTYLISGLVIATLADSSITCDKTELLRINIPASVNTTCTEYLKDFINVAGGYVDSNTENGQGCFYCQASNANQVLSSRGIGGRREGWRNIGIFCAFVVLNFAGVFILYWAVFQRSKRHTKK